VSDSCNVLMIFPKFNPKSFWSYDGACELLGAKYPAAPLGMITLAALLHQRTPGDQDYRAWALREWEWLRASGMIGPSGLINDGLTADCANNGGTTWTYNQGVILGGLAALHAIRSEKQVGD